MATYVNPQGSVDGTSGADTFEFDAPLQNWATIDGLEGIDLLTVDYSAASQVSFFRVSDPFNTGTFYGRVQEGAYGPTLNFFNVEDVRFVGSGFADSFDVAIRPASSALSLTIDGGAGIDTLILDAKTETSPFIFRVEADGSITSSFGAFSNLEKFTISSGSGDDVIHTAGENDWIYAYGGSDEILTGLGDDQVYSESGGDHVDMGVGGYDFFQGNYSTDTAALTVELGDTITVSNGVTALNVESVGIGTGSGDDQFHVTRSGSVTLYGGPGYDTLTYVAVLPGPRDFSVGGYSGMLAGYGADLSFNDLERVVLQGGAYGDSFRVSGTFVPGSISLDGGGGADLLQADFALLSGATSFIVQADGTIVNNRGAFVAFERFQLTGGSAADVFTTQSGNDNLYGGGGDDRLEGGAGLDVLAGGAGNDRLVGGAGGDMLYGDDDDDVLDGGADADLLRGGPGNDLYYVDAGDTIVEAAGEGLDEVRTALAAFTLIADFENLTGLAATGQALTGNALANAIAGGVGNDRLDGAAGADRLAGGRGNDIYFVDAAGDVVVEAANEGTDEVRTALADTTAAAGVEKLTGLLDSGQTLRGNALDNVLAGGTGADQMVGGLGNDLFWVGAGDLVFEKAGEGTDEVRTALAVYTLAANVERLLGTNAAGQTLTGNALANVVTGAAGSDRLDGGGGADQLAGGRGNDVYVVDAGDVVIEAAGAGTDEVRTALAIHALAANVERLVGTSASGQSLTGNALANIIAGGAGNDRLNGGAGADAMSGGGGNDVYTVDDIGDQVVEAAGGGTDSVQSLVTFTLAGAVENLTLLGAAAADATGNGLANVLSGNGAANRLTGLGGDDTLAGGAGDDMLAGGAGRDLLAGGAGADGFLFDTAPGQADRIIDFAAADDTIVLDRAVFAAIAPGTLAAGAFHAGTAAHDADDRIVYDAATGRIWYDADGNGAGAALLFAQVNSNTILGAGDFLAI